MVIFIQLYPQSNAPTRRSITPRQHQPISLLLPFVVNDNLVLPSMRLMIIMLFYLFTIALCAILLTPKNPSRASPFTTTQITWVHHIISYQSNLSTGSLIILIVIKTKCFYFTLVMSHLIPQVKFSYIGLTVYKKMYIIVV
eukprot:129493_1